MPLEFSVIKSRVCTYAKKKIMFERNVGLFFLSCLQTHKISCSNKNYWGGQFCVAQASRGRLATLLFGQTKH